MEVKRKRFGFTVPGWDLGFGVWVWGSGLVFRVGVQGWGVERASKCNGKPNEM